jgi:hypothetical protein
VFFAFLINLMQNIFIYFPVKDKNIPGAAHRTLEGLLQLFEQVAGAAAAPLNLLCRHQKSLKRTIP